MMDEIFFGVPAECQECHKIYEAGIMIWLNGKCLCPKCYQQEKDIEVTKARFPDNNNML